MARFVKTELLEQQSAGILHAVGLTVSVSGYCILLMRTGTMARLRLRTVQDAPDYSKNLLVMAEKRNGFLSNMLRVLANAPVALETYLTVSLINSRCSLSIAEREAVLITAAAMHGCGFCVAGHTFTAYKQAGLDQEMVE